MKTKKQVEICTFAQKLSTMQHIIDRFISYVTVDTESDPNSETTPSSAKQWDLAHQLVAELKQIGLQDVTIDDKAYIMATLPSNIDKKRLLILQARM